MAEKFEILKKIRALAEAGVDGEKDNARELLEKLMYKYGIDEVNISDEKLEMHNFRFHNNWDKWLLQRIIKKVAADRDLYVYKGGPGSRTTYACACTETEAIQIQLEYEFYSALWTDELETFFQAFIAKHNLFNPSPNQTTGEVDPELIERLCAMMAGMQDKEPPLLLQVENQN